MKKLFMLTFANIRKSKGNTVSLFMMFFIAALLLNAGLLVFTNFGGFFEKTIKELNASNVYYLVPSHLYNNQVDDYITKDNNVLKMQKEDSLWGVATTKYKNDTRERFYLINDADKSRDMSKWKFVGEHLQVGGELLLDEMPIYLPYLYKEDGGYKLNDKFEMSFKDVKFVFTIKGFTEDVFFSSLETGFIGAYLPHDTYQKVSSKLGDTYNTKVVFANLQKINKEVETGIREITKADLVSASKDTTNAIFSMDLQLVKMSRIMMAGMVSIMMVAFATIIVGVCLMVVRFRIGNSIEDDMTKIGSLKAIGYTSRQIISSIVMQFVMIAFIGSIVGIALSYSITPMLSDVFAQQSGLMWVQGFDGLISSITLFIIILIVIIVAMITARRINKLNPIVAMRGGIITHNFSKNHLPLSTTKGSLPIVLAFKSILQNMKQSIMIVVILTAVSFAGTFAVVMFYNTTIDMKAFIETPGVELSNVLAVLKPDADNKRLVENIKNMSGVRKAQFIDEVVVRIDNNEVNTYVMDDYSMKETNTVYDGRYPLHSNEIVIAGHLADLIEKNIGDSVTLKLGDVQSEFLITGLSQGAYMAGMNASIRTDSIIKLNPDFKRQSLQIYLEKDLNAGEFVERLKNLYGDSLATTLDMDESMKVGAGVYASIVSKVGIVILIVTIAVVILVLYFVINSSVVRKKREIGIQKALGFTTLQLMNQLSLSFLTPIIIGVCIGCVIGITQTNVIMSAAQKGMGIMKASFIITPVWIALFGVAIVMVSYITSMLITYSIRKISAYGLVSE
ncbi:ABC transporter permease [Clostridium sp. CS001]|uniref:ABC transporter permease n=1 Tax=Clostridium sp. CS001 TaxID=2880648 RepID=UPI001CF4E756|nr:ABC transporter permease [Clostridium sp. CS001]MCB2291420.1 ABC transporter permease [Clostridium sp. CS001]